MTNYVKTYAFKPNAIGYLTRNEYYSGDDDGFTRQYVLSMGDGTQLGQFSEIPPHKSAACAWENCGKPTN